MTAGPMGFRTFGDVGADRDDEPGRHRGGPPRDVPPPLAPGRLSWRSFLIVLAFAGVLLLAALGGDLRVLTLHEVFAAQTAREMLATGEWVVPHFAGVPRLNKPPGMYYLIAAAMGLFQSRAEWVARLPAALAGVATALMVARLAARWLGDLAGLVAGLMQATFYYVLMQARLAEADMPMCAAVVLAMSAFADGAVAPPPGLTPRRRAVLALLFGAGTGLSILLKGVGGVFIPAGCLLWIVATRNWRALRFLAHPLALLPLLALAGAWPVAVYVRNPAILRTWRQETEGRVTGEFNDPDPWHIYFWAVPLMLLPWLPFAVRGLAVWWEGLDERHRPGPRPGRPGRLAALLADHPRAAFLACWFVGGMAVLLFSQARHKHYPIPMLPAVTPLAAAGFVHWLRTTGGGRPRRPWLATAVVLAVGAVAAVAVLAWAPKARVGSAVTAAAVAAGVAAVVLAYQSGRARAVATACFATALAGGVGFQFLILPAYDDYKASAALARRTNAVVPPGRPVYLVALGQAHAAYYLDRPLVRVDRRREIESAFAAASPGEDAYVLCPASVVPLLAAVGEATELDRVDHLRRTENDPLVLARLRPAGR